MKILVFLPRQLGGSLLSLPALRALRMNFPTSEITLVANESFSGLLARLLPDYSFFSFPEIKDIKKLKSASQLMARQHFDLAVLLEDSFASALLVYLARIPERWGYDRENRGFMLTRKIRLKYTDPPLHLMDYYLNLLKKFGLRTEGAKNHCSLSEDTLRVAASKLHQAGLSSSDNLIVLKPGSSYGLARVWPLDYQIELVDKLLGLKAEIVLLGSAASQPVCEKISSFFNARLYNLAGRWPLEELPGILALARVYIGNDGGLTHLANALGRPVIALYGPTDAKICGPALPPSYTFQQPVPCSPCSYKNCPYDHRCLKEIAPEDVFKKVVELGQFQI
ncbi:MAG: lipopolysaccharide heptosyltransferase II [Candidatus Aminicenantes bacterium]|nr:lipopolysaccharide heptosyltransferase II [Candidatus Aminicenantes bacterium]